MKDGLQQMLYRFAVIHETLSTKGLNWTPLYVRAHRNIRNIDPQKVLSFSTYLDTEVEDFLSSYQLPNYHLILTEHWTVLKILTFL